MKKTLALTLLLLLITSLAAGCSTGTQTQPDSNATAEPIASTSAAPAKAEQPKAVADGGEFMLPITDSTVTFTSWNSWDISPSGMTSNNDSKAYIELEKRTNVHIEWFHPASAQATENFNLSIASGDYYDTYYITPTYMVGGPDYYIDNNIFIDIMPYLKDYAPNYEHVRMLDPKTTPTTLTDKGYAPGFCQIAKTLQWPWLGPLGRTDWLKELNLAVPETYDELHDVLVAFRDVKNAEFPLSLTSAGTDGWLMAGFDTMYVPSMNLNFFQVDGQVRFGATEPGFKDYLTLLNTWYAEGLIDKDFYSKTAFMDQPASNVGDVTTGKVGVGRSLYTFPDFMSNQAKAAGIEGLEWNAFYVPVKVKGDIRKVSMESTAVDFSKSNMSTISSACEDIETLMRWFDYLYTEEGSILGNYGIEGEGYTMVDGRPKTTALIYNDQEGRAMNTMFPIYAMAQTQPMWYDWERELGPETSQNVFDTKERFEKNWTGEWTMPVVSPTSEESAEYSSIINDINTLISENVVSFITGQRPMSEYDSFIDQIKSMNIDRAVEIQQAALDRYNNRVK